MPAAPVGFNINRYGAMIPNTHTPGGANPVAPVDAPDLASVPFYESGPFWVLAFLVVGYILVYRTLR